MNEETQQPGSPCIGVCVMNPTTDYCDGCYRTLNEIEHWWEYNSETKSRVLAKLHEREADLQASLWNE